ncbi:MAG: lysylphosphatidylglycerol synthase transmembrane domain-containing protein [Candidatus Diapherotrites archaeon]
MRLRGIHLSVKTEKAERLLRIAAIVLALVSLAVLLFGFFTGAFFLIYQANFLFLLLSIACFLFSIAAWLFAWAFLVVKRKRMPFKRVFLAGCASVFGSLTPVQLGSDVLRGLFLKEEFNAPFSEGFSASLIVKGLKFSALSLASLAFLFVVFFGQGFGSFAIPLFSGLFVVLLATLLFLLPLKKSMGCRISRFFGLLSRKIPQLKPLEKYFLDYSDFLAQFSGKALLATMLLAAISWILEFASLFFAFASLSIEINLLSLSALFILLALLERAPFLPHGILLVESAGFAFLSMPLAGQPSLSLPEIGSVLILYDISRLIFPSVASLCFYFWREKSRKGITTARI